MVLNSPGSVETKKRSNYEKPRLTLLGRLTEVTKKSGGNEDGAAAMMSKSGGG